MVSALKSLCITFLTSSVFRLILLDAISIGRDLVAHAASDVSSAALRVHGFAENLEEQADTADFWVDPDSQEVSLQQAVSELVEVGKGAASAAARGVQETMEEEKQEWKERVEGAEEEVKRRLLVRVQEVGLVITRVQNTSNSHYHRWLSELRKTLHHDRPCWQFSRLSVNTLASSCSRPTKQLPAYKKPPKEGLKRVLRAARENILPNKELPNRHLIHSRTHPSHTQPCPILSFSFRELK